MVYAEKKKNWFGLNSNLCLASIPINFIICSTASLDFQLPSLFRLNILLKVCKTFGRNLLWQPARRRKKNSFAVKLLSHWVALLASRNAHQMFISPFCSDVAECKIFSFDEKSNANV